MFRHKRFSPSGSTIRKHDDEGTEQDETEGGDQVEHGPWSKKTPPNASMA